MPETPAPRGRFDDLVAGTGTRFDGVRRVAPDTARSAP
ncbi:hypothetical protein BG618_01927 [Pseudonocardia autotrophica]|jgi:hypothetical protein|nr:hypothetical protein BG618_01927 [Pseudonocardia autotrophica]